MQFIESIFSTPLGFVMRWFFELVGNFPVALILFTLLSRIILLPLTIKQQRTSAKTALLQPKIKAIQEKYKNNKQKQSEEINRLYSQEKVNPMGGCLPLIIQMVIMYGLIFVIYKPLTYILRVPTDIISQAASAIQTTGMYSEIEIVHQAANAIGAVPELANYGIESLNFNLFGILDLSATPAIGEPSLLWSIPIASGVFQIMSIRVNNYFQKKNGMPVMKSALMNWVMPLMFVWIAFSVPAGVGFYWACGSLIAVFQSIFMSTVYSPARINARSEYRHAKKRLENEAKRKISRG
ncbi:YidC/Oxa1 family membrane protein insertase [Solibaculum mannosilyticum]|uniref:Membrane insertase YidC/Oxa/ALB C-terminal domain-containing protein n=1 Tax=Solibaculum mannosilyticum TaxID=2780922 RepID=A0A7I8D4B7_9FIRM|nr:YidC/Oxa1 family membrane protein insertase [Solibaculum mannosilyticum]BCI61600.1 hypothetical protein C12CBH8_22390 [Solibaculum mannosilyticum]CZT56182.1 Membrane protein insertase YidC [Eubacteriaceae bacterium CHKCI005]